MNSNQDTTQIPGEATTAGAPQSEAAAAKAKAKASKTAKGKKALNPPRGTKPAPAESDGEVTDRLPTTLKELKETKGGLAASLFLTGKDMDAIAKELKATFKLSEEHALKITRRITGRVRLYRRIFELVPVKK